MCAYFIATSAIKAEVEIVTDPTTQENKRLLEMLRESAKHNGKVS